ncbi:MAG: PH domain-containing protein [Phycisphaerae bacterium]|nr:PH domain-containing protein [Phycisphaerae bacterium]
MPQQHAGSSTQPFGARTAFDPRTIERPAPSLLTYYLICSLAGLVLAPLVFIPLWIKYATLRYRFDDEGVALSWGYLFRHETYLTYRRIQDIHVSRNIVQRWMNLATVSVQTASGSSKPELSVDGVTEFDALRDFLYTRMRGAREDHGVAPVGSPAGGREAPGSGGDEVVELLRDIRLGVARLSARVDRIEREARG